MRSTESGIHGINLRDLEFENKVWKNKLDYLIHEIHIHIHHIECYQTESKDSILKPLIDESLKELNNNREMAESLKKKVILQEEEIPLYIKDFPIDKKHQLFVEHQVLEKEVDAFYHQHKERIVMIRKILAGIFVM